MTIEIRKVTKDDDFDALGNIYATSWQQAYKTIVPQNYLDTLQGTRWSERLATLQYDAFVAIKDGLYIGTASIAPARDDVMLGWGEIMSIYLLPEYTNKGYGTTLFNYVIKKLLEQGFTSIYLWVLEANQIARNFYEKQGFQQNGKQAIITIADIELVELCYVRHFE